ncbi:MAG: GNAT family N-acetyltransferase, partial [Acidobacteriota bacterium]|nr:GNAT family N-acetyltransferase [Acidobacteriota bacterium]
MSQTTGSAVGETAAGPNSSIRIREAGDEDAQAVCEIFRAVYGGDYTYPHFFDVHQMKKIIFGEDTLVLVAEDTAAGRILGTAAVILEVGAYSDLVGEFGRLVVHPDARGRGLGKLLMEERLRRVRDRLQVGLVEARVAHPFAQKISRRYGFAPVGFLASKHRFGDYRDSVALLVQYFGHALRLRRNHPRVIPEVYPMAMAAFRNVSMEPDAIVVEREPSYPGGEDYEIQELTDEGYSSLLRIERGRRQDREVFGPLRLHYGFFKLQAHRSSYIIARKGSHIAGALGYTYDEYEGNIRVFELIILEEHSIPFLLENLERECADLPNVRALEIDVSAYAPRMQRTLVERGFVPVAYIP